MKNFLQKARLIATQGVFVAIVSLIFSESAFMSSYSYPADPNHPPPGWLLAWRLGSLILLLLFSVISIPRWQALIGLLAAFLFIYYLQGY
jgi:integral membrane sensor domain MASE1